jgi:eukaryotic translation initiation factor 2C
MYNTTSLKADDLQLITFYLCHAYQRCMKSVSLPAPLYYARLENERKLLHYKGACDLKGVQGMFAGGSAVAVLERQREAREFEMQLKDEERRFEEYIEDPMVCVCTASTHK